MVWQKMYLDFICEVFRDVELISGCKVVDLMVGVFGLFGMILWILCWYQFGGWFIDEQVV